MMTEKTCSKCAATKPLVEFCRDASKKSGYGSRCKSCSAAKTRAYHAKMKTDSAYVAAYKERSAEWRTRNPQRSNALVREWVENNPDKIKAIKQKSKDKHRDRTNALLRERSAAEPGWQSERARRWRLNNPEKSRAALQRRRTAVRVATPVWFSELDELVTQQANELAVLRERATGFKWHVDHIIPLRGKQVSGLHVWNNLRVIPAEVNLRKSNRYEVQQ